MKNIIIILIFISGFFCAAFADISPALYKPIESLRKEVNNIDEQIIQLVEKRNDVVEKIAEYKNEHDLPIASPHRNELLKQRHAILAEKYKVSEEKIGKIFDTIMTP